MPFTYTPSSSSSSYSMPCSPVRLLALVAAAASLAAAQYVPGPVDDTPGAALVTMGAGVDGYTTYVIEGVTLQENANSAVMTQYDVNGVPTVYNCALGADAQATCTVSQGNGVAYNYIEPITYFGESTGQLPAAFMTTATPLAGASNAAATPLSSSAQATSAPSSPAAAVSPNRAGPAAGQAQQTGQNVFGAADTGAATSSYRMTNAVALLGSAAAALFGGVMLFA